MPDIELGSHTIKSHGFKVATTHKHDWLILLLLVVIEAILLVIEPFHRFVGEDMMTDVKYPLKGNTVPFWAVPILAIVFPFVVFLVYYLIRKDVYDFHHAVLGLLFSVLLTAVITDSVKDAVGRPRPDFFWRCFPDGKGVFDPITQGVICHGDKAVIKEGHKSFPSGHSSWSFAGLSYLSWYLAGKIRAFDRRGHVAKLCIILFPLLLATLVAISRVDDYWHHWQDVFAGALIGSVIAAICYLQFFPYPNDVNGWAPHTFFRMMEERNRGHSSAQRVNSFHPQQPEVAPHAYFQMMEERNRAHSSAQRVNSFHPQQPEVAPHAYFQMMEERNRAHSSAQRVNSFHPQQPEVEASFMGRNNGIESTESSSREHDTTCVLDAMEAGRKY